MANPTLNQILNVARKLVANKQASAKAAAITGESPDSMPGSENDSAVPDEAKKPQKETRDGTMVPNSGLSTEGAGDDSAITHTGDLEADEAAKTPTKKPLVSADAGAKTAADSTADLANDILSLIRGSQKQAGAISAAVEAGKKVVSKGVEAAKAVGGKGVSAAESVGEKAKEVGEKGVEAAKNHSGHLLAGAGGAVVGGGTVAALDHNKKAEGLLDLQLTTDVMAKLAALILSTEEGAQMAEQVLQKQAGAEMAKETLAFLAAQSEMAEKAAAWDAGQADAQALIDQQLVSHGAELQKQAEREAMLFKLGQANADASIGDMMGGAGGADAGAAGPAAGGADAGAEGGEGEISMEDLVAALQALVEEGSVKPEEAQQILEYVTSDGAGGADAGAGAADDADAGAAAGGDAGGAGEADPAAAEAPVNGADKTASLLDAIRQLKAKKA